MRSVRRNISRNISFIKNRQALERVNVIMTLLMYVGLAVAILILLLLVAAVVYAIVTEEEDEDRDDEGWQ
jgi:hypothetical protein